MCTGEEENLLQCSRVPELNVGESDCTHYEDAGVRCEGREKPIVHLGRPHVCLTQQSGRYLNSVPGLQLLLLCLLHFKVYVCILLYNVLYT